jgi:hypothetical protein
MRRPSERCGKRFTAEGAEGAEKERRRKER